jgi:uncharacterized protein
MKYSYWLIGAVLLAATPAIAQQPESRQPRLINVTGTGVVQRQPDRAVIMIAVESRAATAQAATQANAKRMDAVYATLKRMGITPPKAQTTSYTLYPEYGQPEPRSVKPETPRIIGYVANNSVRVELDSITRAGDVIDAVIAAGANRIDNLSFELRDMESARLEAIKMAVARAKAEAEVLATAAGQKLGKPISISSSSAWVPMPRYRMEGMAMSTQAPAMATSIEAGSLSVTANVTISYAIEDL